MKPNPMLLAGAAVLALGAALATPAEAQTAPATSTLNFDSFATGAALGSYGGFTWTHWIPDTVNGAGTAYFSHSPDTWVYATDNLNSIYRATSFVFDGAWFSGPALIADPANAYAPPLQNKLQYQLWLGGAVVFTGSYFTPSSTASTLQASGYSGAVDKVVVLAKVADHFAMDDFSFSAYTAPVAPPVIPPSPVPEPAPLALLFGGLALVLAGRFCATGRTGR